MKFSYQYPSKPPEPEKKDMELWFEEDGSGVLIKAGDPDRDADDDGENIAYLNSSGHVHVYPRQAKRVGLDMRKPYCWK